MRGMTPSPIRAPAQPTDTATYVVVALYKFVDLSSEELPSLKASLSGFCEAHGIHGTLLLAEEGLNGTVAGSADAIEALLAELRARPAFADIDAKLSRSAERPFNRLKVKCKREIVSIGDTSVRPADRVGRYVEPEDWNSLIREPDVLVVDTRNDYEFRVGRFENAVNPDTASFTEFPRYAAEKLDPAKHKRVAMYCTGGIRCEKSTSLLVAEGFEEVYHLRGGILRYLERVPESESLWQGECFVFDQRVALTHGLAEGSHILCFACQEPLSPEDVAHESYEEGVSCRFCVESQTPERQAALRERVRQFRHARSRGEHHIGDDSVLSRRARDDRTSSTSSTGAAEVSSDDGAGDV